MNRNTPIKFLDFLDKPISKLKIIFIWIFGICLSVVLITIILYFLGTASIHTLLVILIILAFIITLNLLPK